jgi:hypothetical protein
MAHDPALPALVMPTADGPVLVLAGTIDPTAAADFVRHHAPAALGQDVAGWLAEAVNRDGDWQVWRPGEPMPGPGGRLVVGPAAQRSLWRLDGPMAEPS